MHEFTGKIKAQNQLLTEYKQCLIITFQYHTKVYSMSFKPIWFGCRPVGLSQVTSIHQEPLPQVGCTI